MGVVDTSWKVQGWGFRVKAIGSFILGAVFSVAGLFLWVSNPSSNLWILPILGLVLIFVGWYHWRISKTMIKGHDHIFFGPKEVLKSLKGQHNHVS